MQIHWHNTDAIGASQREAVESRLQALAADHTDLIDVWIRAKETGHHRHGGQEIHISCQARGADIVAKRTRPDLGLALDEALDAFAREVRRLRDRREKSRNERPVGPPLLGIIDRVFVEDGYGFILTDAGEQVYFHRNALQGLEFERVAEGDRVGLDVEAGEEGPQATAVVAPPPDASGP